MPLAVFTKEEIAQRGEEIYERELRKQVEPSFNGQFVVVDIETGEYEIDRNEVAAIERVRAKNPNGARYIKRIGYSAAHRLGSKFVIKGS